ncbi:MULTISPECIES: WXG100 family type VII secretion target [unclassified Nocardioides]|jgi:WXG100 family type VII secretion target|uniref:WXG100 family type VII secretion target n=1 Tax=unclassified Nocardioides TaxID=2615069 RepID=UPI0007030E07|nr:MULTISPECIES: WXG100 family type VII secretion target [unclassified Nocardioides]KRC54960.1 type VII secretion protein [Nocardioides sp. Root79]KRC73691.1 type VII secretion protein [Nocardioides sp. Root240]
MSNINVTYDDIRNVAAHLRQGRDDMTNKLNELGAMVDNLVSSGFVTDQASGAYNDQFDQFQAGTKTAIDALEGLSSFLDQAAQALQDTDTGLANSIKA